MSRDREAFSIIDGAKYSLEQVQYLSSIDEHKPLGIETDEVQKFLFYWDQVFLYGLRSARRGYWGFVSAISHPALVNEVKNVPGAVNDLLRSRLWLGAILNDNELENYLTAVLHEQKLLEKYYRPYAIIRNRSHVDDLISIACGQENTLFAIHLDYICFRSKELFVGPSDRSSFTKLFDIKFNWDESIRVRSGSCMSRASSVSSNYYRPAPTPTSTTPVADVALPSPTSDLPRLLTRPDRDSPSPDLRLLTATTPVRASFPVKKQRLNTASSFSIAEEQLPNHETVEYSRKPSATNLTINSTASADSLADSPRHVAATTTLPSIPLISDSPGNKPADTADIDIPLFEDSTSTIVRPEYESVGSPKANRTDVSLSQKPYEDSASDSPKPSSQYHISVVPASTDGYQEFTSAKSALVGTPPSRNSGHVPSPIGTPPSRNPGHVPSHTGTPPSRHSIQTQSPRSSSKQSLLLGNSPPSRGSFPNLIQKETAPARGSLPNLAVTPPRSRCSSPMPGSSVGSGVSGLVTRNFSEDDSRPVSPSCSLLSPTDVPRLVSPNGSSSPRERVCHFSSETDSKGGCEIDPAQYEIRSINESQGQEADSDLYSEEEGPDMVLLDDMGIQSETDSETKEPGSENIPLSGAISPTMIFSEEDDHPEREYVVYDNPDPTETDGDTSPSSSHVTVVTQTSVPMVTQTFVSSVNQTSVSNSTWHVSEELPGPVEEGEDQEQSLDRTMTPKELLLALNPPIASPQLDGSSPQGTPNLNTTPIGTPAPSRLDTSPLGTTQIIPDLSDIDTSQIGGSGLETETGDASVPPTDDPFDDSSSDSVTLGNNANLDVVAPPEATEDVPPPEATDDVPSVSGAAEEPYVSGAAEEPSVSGAVEEPSVSGAVEERSVSGVELLVPDVPETSGHVTVPATVEPTSETDVPDFSLVTLDRELGTVSPSPNQKISWTMELFGDHEDFCFLYRIWLKDVAGNLEPGFFLLSTKQIYLMDHLYLVKHRVPLGSVSYGRGYNWQTITLFVVAEDGTTDQVDVITGCEAISRGIMEGLSVNETYPVTWAVEESYSQMRLKYHVGLFLQGQEKFTMEGLENLFYGVASWSSLSNPPPNALQFPVSEGKMWLKEATLLTYVWKEYYFILDKEGKLSQFDIECAGSIKKQYTVIGSQGCRKMTPKETTKQSAFKFTSEEGVQVLLNCESALERDRWMSAICKTAMEIPQLSSDQPYGMQCSVVVNESFILLVREGIKRAFTLDFTQIQDVSGIKWREDLELCVVKSSKRDWLMLFRDTYERNKFMERVSDKWRETFQCDSLELLFTHLPDDHPDLDGLLAILTSYRDFTSGRTDQQNRISDFECL